MPKVIGIDLGTTNSYVAVMEGGEPVIIPNAEGYRMTPSIVAFNKSGERLVGEAAKRQAITNAENTIYSIKRFMGRRFDDPFAQRDRSLTPYKVVSSPTGDAWFEVMGKQYSPPEISAMILQNLRINAEAYLGERVTQAVITVPAYFNDAQRQATRDAGRIAGLEALRIINEPTAASLAYGLQRKKDERIAVYDLGGGTFDISVLELGDGVFEVKATNGDTHLGGDDFDQRIINWLADEFKREVGIDLRMDRMAVQRLKEGAEKAKKELSSAAQTEINLPFITADASGPKHLLMTLTRAKLEQLTADLIGRTSAPVNKCLQDAGVNASQIDEVVLIGGMTRMPAVQAAVSRLFGGKTPNKGVHPDEAVALGAAIQAGILTGDVRDVLLLDLMPHSLGIETAGGVFTTLIPRNATIPTQKSQVFSTASDNQTAVEINVLQGESEMARDNTSLGRFVLDGIPPAPRGTPQIEVTYDIDYNGIVNVHAKDKGTGREQRVTVQPASGLSGDDVLRMVREAAAGANNGRGEAALAQLRNEADSAANNAEKTLKDLGAKVSGPTKTTVMQRIADLRATLATNDTARITSAKDALQTAMFKMSEELYLAPATVTPTAKSAGSGKLSGRRVFISHSGENEWCAAFAAGLKRMGADVWYDVSGLHGGADWLAMIEREIEARSTFIVLLTPKAWASEWVQREIRLAMAIKGWVIIPVILAPTDMTGFIRTIQWVDAKGKKAPAAADLVATHLLALGK